MKISGKLPDLTPAQLVAALTGVVAQAVAYGWLDTVRSQLVLSVGSTLITVGWHIADAIIRHGRAQAVAANPSLLNGGK